MIPMHYGTFPLGNEPLEEPVDRLLDRGRPPGDQRAGADPRGRGGDRVVIR